MTRERPEILAYEQWFRAAGVPAFIKGYSSVKSVLRRLHIVLLWTALLTAAALLTLLIVGWLQFSDEQLDVTAVDVLVIALPALLVSWWLTAVGFGTVAVFAFKWFVSQLVHGQSRVFSVLPLVIAALMFLVYTGETWQTVGRLSGTPFSLVLLLFVGLIVMFLLRRGIKGDIVDARVRGWNDLERTLPRGLPEPRREGLINNPKFARTEIANVVVVMLLGKALVAFGLGLLVGLFFYALAVLSISVDTVTAWSGDAPSIWWSFDLGGTTYAITSAHTRVAAFVGLFASFYFVISSAADASLNREVNDATERHIRAALAARSAYRQWRHLPNEVPRAGDDDAVTDSAAELRRDAIEDSVQPPGAPRRPAS